MKKLISVLLVLILSLSIVATGCAREKETSVDGAKSSSSEGTSSSNSSNDSEELTFPLKEKIKFSVFVHTRPNVDDFENNEFTKWLEEKTNIEFEFIVAPENEAREKLNLLLSTGDYPDMILGTLNTAQIALYGSQNTLVPLNTYIEKYGVNTKKAFEQFPVVEDLYTMKDGNIYNLPVINECFHCQATQKLWVYKPWLDALGLDVPQTTDEFYDMLIAFRDNDPNGNGIKDEIPLSGAIKGWNSEVEAFIMNAFVYNGSKKLYLEDGQVTASFLQDGWKEGLKYLQMLRKEGLLDPNSFTQDGEALKQLGENPEVMILGTAPGGYEGSFSQIGGESGRWEEFVTIPPLKGPSGNRTTLYNPFIGSTGISITKACEYPEIAFMLADLFYSQEVTLRSTIGRPGIEWDYSDGSVKGLNGEPAIWKELIMLNTQESNIHWNQLGANFRPAEFRLGREATEDQKLEIILYRETKNNYEPYFPAVDTLVPPLTLTEDQSATLLSYETTINNYVDEKIAEFILNDIDVDAAWDGYINELKAMGVDAFLGVYQEAYEDTK